MGEFVVLIWLFICDYDGICVLRVFNGVLEIVVSGC